jgi:hypothetical protein
VFRSMNAEVPQKWFIACISFSEDLSRRQSSVAGAACEVLAFQGHVLVLAGCAAYVPLNRICIESLTSQKATAMLPNTDEEQFPCAKVGSHERLEKWSSLLPVAALATSEHGPGGDQIHS